ncbi:hypothetical protein [Nannocystis radixulma]|uniref:Uncharacterized protein n=1 Tax=Nannocystis radixulma TaxID=2995305 RepID=A0ABT5B6C7_9BACT|nr:hypothetical protein [Nannocystis radixulma]MDC0668601.1 hypothetical protein [Nannocystis radixulma]
MDDSSVVARGGFVVGAVPTGVRDARPVDELLALNYFRALGDDNQIMAKPAKWKPISRDMAGRFVAIAPGGEFVVFGDFVVTIDGKPTKTVVVQHRSGESIEVAIPGTLGGLAMLPDQRIVASVQATWIPNSTQKDYAAAGLVIAETSGRIVGRVADPSLAGAGVVVVDSTGSRLALVIAQRDVGQPNYGSSRVVWTTVDDVLAGRPITHSLTFESVVPAIAFAADGTLLVVANSKLTTVQPDGTVGEGALPSAGAFHSPGGSGPPFDPQRLTASGARVAAVGHLDQVVVFEAGEPLLEIAGNISSHAVLCDQGQTLITSAGAAKKRMGKDAEASIAWPDPAMVGDYVAVWDVTAKRVRRVLPRASGQLVALAVAPGHFLAVATSGNKFKIELVPWSELAG